MRFTALIFSVLLWQVSTAQTTFFEATDAFLKAHVEDGKVLYDKAQNSPELEALVQQIGTLSTDEWDAATRQAFYINAYNLLTIQAAAKAYPIGSVLQVNGFFDAKKHLVAGEMITLNVLEKEWLLQDFGDARFHFVLVCGALDCPPITDFAYRAEQLDAQLAQQTRLALNDPNFIRVHASEQTVELSQIFEWYRKDFGGGKKAALEFINAYRENPIPANYTSRFYVYDWTLNDANPNPFSTAGSNNAARYVVSATVPKNTAEIKIFNNLYTQRTGSGDGDLTDRSTFFTTIASVVYGVSDRMNVGFDLRYRRSRFEGLPVSLLHVFESGSSSDLRVGVTTIGPKIRYAPFEHLPNFSVQSAFWISTRSDWEGVNERPFLDWNGSSWFTQLFNDIPLGRSFSVFTELDLFWEDIGLVSTGHLNRFSTPVTVIGSYFPNPKTTLYVLTNYSPFWQREFDYFAQGGLGAKYQFTPDFELELLYNYFTNAFLIENQGQAATYNLGVRFNLR